VGSSPQFVLSKDFSGQSRAKAVGFHSGVKPVPTSIGSPAIGRGTRDSARSTAGPARSKPDHPGANGVVVVDDLKGPKQTFFTDVGGPWPRWVCPPFPAAQGP